MTTRFADGHDEPNHIDHRIDRPHLTHDRDHGAADEHHLRVEQRRDHRHANG